MAQWTGQSKGSLLGYKIFFFVLKSFGITTAYFVLRFVAAYFFLFSFDSTRAIYKFLRYRIGFGIIRSVFGVYQNYYVFGKSLLDRFAVMAGLTNKFTYTFEGEEHLQKMVALGRGGILVSAHIGNWEVAGHLLSRIKSKVNIVMLDSEHQKIKKYFDSVKGSTALNIIPIKTDISHIYAISEALERKELICIHGDRFMKGNKTTEVDFMGAKAAFPIGPMSLCYTLKVPFTYVFAMKESDTHYHFFATDLYEFNLASDKKSHEQIKTEVQTYASNMEKMVRKYPFQWFNFYDFWAKV